MRSEVKLSSGAFRHVEAELYLFHETKRELERLQNEILYGSPEPNRTGGGKSNTPSDHTGLAVIALLDSKRINILREVYEAVCAVYGLLDNDRKKLIELRYWTQPQRFTWDGLAMEIGKDRSTLIRWRNDIVHAIADRLGWR